MLTSAKVLKKLEEHKTEINLCGAKRIGPFGSLVRCERTPGSDIDVLVEFERSKKTFDDYLGLNFLLEGLFEREGSFLN